jgi:hypothetical protein
VALKRDDTFLQDLTMGAVGSANVARNLKGHGHQVLELERYTTSNKIWATKIKRLRLPDLLCLLCGVRVEVRAKSKLEVKLSDSPTVAGRGWDAGLRNDDLVAFIRVAWDGQAALPSGGVEYFRVADLRATVAASRLGPPKSASEGAERDRTWPASVASRAGRVIALNRTHITITWQNGSSRRMPLRQGFHAYLAVGDVVADGQLISGVAPHVGSVVCPGDTWDPLDRNTDADAGARYAAIKALGFRGEVTSALARLRAAWENETEDLRIRLEALAGLSRRAPEAWLPVLAEFRKTLEPDMAMEAVFILAELPLPLAVEVLAALVADRNLPDELRAAAAWGLGVGGHHRPELLLDHFEDSSDDVALHSLVAIGSELSETALEHVADRIQNGERAAAAAVAVLSRHGVFGARVLLRRVESFRSARANAWVLVGLGLLGRQTVQAAAGDPLPADFSHSLEPVWIGLTESWILGERASSRDFLSRQTVRERIAT